MTMLLAIYTSAQRNYLWFVVDSVMLRNLFFASNSVTINPTNLTLISAQESLVKASVMFIDVQE